MPFVQSMTPPPYYDKGSALAAVSLNGLDHSASITAIRRLRVD